MNRILFTYIFLSISFGLFAQGGASVADDKGVSKFRLSDKAKTQLLEKGDSLFVHAAFMESVRIYADVEHNSQINNDVKARMAEAYRCNAEYELAEYWYRQYVDEGVDPQTCLNFAKVLQINDRCPEASIWYKRYLASDPKDANDIEVLSDCENLKAIVNHEEIIFYNLEELNTPLSEYGVMNMNEDLVFTSTRKLHKIIKNEDMWTEGNFSDLFVAQADDFGSFSKVDRLRGSANRKFHDGLSAFDKNEYRIYFTRNENKSQNASRLRELKLYTAKVEKDGSWHDVERMDINLKGYSSCHPTISASGSTLVFASNRPGGQGGMDLYISKKKDGKWSAPQNLGKQINSPSNEIFPFVSKTNDLFFSSDGHVGLGGLDLYRANLRNKMILSEGDWQVLNMGRPFNSNKDDFTFSMAGDGLSGYIASNRDGGTGKDDIYRWVRTSNDPLILDWYNKEICLDDIFTNDRIQDAEIQLFEFADRLKYISEKSNGLEIVEDLDDKIKQTIESVIDVRQLRLLNMYPIAIKGSRYERIKMKPNRDYLIVVNKEGFFTSQKLVTATENAAVYSECIDLSLEPIRNLNGRVTADLDEVELSAIGIKLFNHCTKNKEIIYPDTDGKFTYELKCSCAYDLEVDQFGFEYFKKEFANYFENCSQVTEKVDINLVNSNPFVEEKIEKGKVFTLKNILYEFDSASLTASSIIELNYLVDLLKNQPKVTIDLTAFTDSRGNSDYNMSLSKERAKSAAEHLFRNGIDRVRVQYIGMGESVLLNGCKDGVKCSENEHQMNRRTEVKITSL